MPHQLSLLRLQLHGMLLFVVCSKLTSRTGGKLCGEPEVLGGENCSSGVLPTLMEGLGSSLEMEAGLAYAMMPVTWVSIWLPDLRIISNKEDEVMALPSVAVGTYASSSISLGFIFLTDY